MYFDFFGLSEAPFRITPHTDFFFAGANRGATLDALLYTITQDEGIVKVSGEVGSGKTMLCRVLMERLPQHVEIIYLANPSLSRDEILIAIADELKLNPDGEHGTRVLRSIQDALIERYAAGRRVVVLIDEAHAMPRESLEEIRLLSNLETNRNKLLQIVLFGQPELDDLLNTAEMRQLKERITHGFHLEPLIRSDIHSYIDYRMRAAGYRGPNPFSPVAIRRIDVASKGLTRRINILADKSLLAAFAANTHTVGEREAKRAVADSDFYRPSAKYGRVAIVSGGIAASVAIGYTLALLLTGTPPSALAPTAMLPRIEPARQASADQVTAQIGTGDRDTLPIQSTAASSATDLKIENRPKESSTETPDNKQSAGNLPSAGVTVLGKRTQQRFAATQDWLREAPGKNYAIQLITVSDAEPWRLENFLGRAQKVLPGQDFHIYSVKINGIQHYRVALGNYSTVQDVRNAMAELPSELKAPNPFVRSIERMRSQNSQ